MIVAGAGRAVPSSTYVDDEPAGGREWLVAAARTLDSTTCAQRWGVNWRLNSSLPVPIARRSSALAPLMRANACARPDALPGLTTAPL